jgi:predicted dehydrogenase
MSELRMAVVGSSGHSARVCAPTIAATPGTGLAAVAGSTVQHARRLADGYDGCAAYGGVGALLAAPDVDAVWVATPNETHAEVATACLDAGKHVLLEKPMATTAADARALQTLADASGLVLRVGFQHRFRPAHVWLHDALQSGSLGRICLVRVHRFWPFPYFPEMSPDPRATWRGSTRGGWALTDIGAHSIDLALWLLGEPARIAYARTDNFKFTDVSGEDTAIVLLETESGAVATIETSNAMPSFPGTVEAHGIDGWARADDTFDGGGTILGSDGERRTFPETTMADAYAGSLRDFVAAVRGEPSCGATAAEAAANAEIVERAAAARQST